MTERSTSYLEGPGELGHVTFPYLTGGAGSRKDKTLGGAILGMTDAELSKVSVLAMLVELKHQLKVEATLSAVRAQ